MNEANYQILNIGNNDSSPTHFSLERRSTLSKSSALIVVYLALEIAKQLLNFALTTSNADQMPLPTTLLVLFIEGSKLLIILLMVLCFKCEDNLVGFSIKFAVPAFCYFFSNVLYLHGITIIAPPIWMILIQTRTLYTALFYKVFLKREITRVQVVGCLFIVGSILLTRIFEFYSGTASLPLNLIFVSQAAALLSSIACLYIEVLLKNDARCFMEQQAWLYTCGIIFGIITLGLTSSKFELQNAFKELDGRNNFIALLVVTIVVSACGGLCVPRIIKNLDSIVKDYLAAINNILLAFSTAVIFPDRFPITFIYLLSLFLLITGIVLYEKKSFKKS